MTTSYVIRLIFVLLLPLAILPPMALAQTREDAIVNSAKSVLDDVMLIPTRRIPNRMLLRAHGLAIVPGVVKGGFVIGVRHGRGVVVVRGDDGAWQPPAFVSMTGGSVGWQAGIQSTDVILVFRTRNSITNLMNGKLTIGVDAAAAAGPVGRQAAAATDGRLAAEILSYSRSRGAFVGVSFDGSVLQIDHAAAMTFYRTTEPNQPPTIPASATNLINRLNFHATVQPNVQAVPTAQVPANAQTVAQLQQVGPQLQPATQIHPQALPNPQAIPTVQPHPHSQRQPNVQPTATFQTPTTVQAPPSTVRSAEPAEMVRLQLTRSWEQLALLLDTNWKTFLVPPAGVLKAGVNIDVEVLTATLQRYASVAANPQFSTLAQRPEFVTTHQLLREYVTLMSASANRTLMLPPPPKETAPTNPTRY